MNNKLNRPEGHKARQLSSGEQYSQSEAVPQKADAQLTSPLIGDRNFLYPPDHGEVTGGEALRRRDALEHFIVPRLPRWIRRPISAALTSITGIAPSATAGIPPWKGSVLRSLSFMLLMLFAGILAILAGPVLAKLAGAVAVISGMRNFTSAVGHHLTHSSKGLPWPAKWTRIGYNILSALLLLPSFEEYRAEHEKHHAHVGGDKDPDQQFIEQVRANLTGWIPFLKTVLNPRFHVRFFEARIRASMGRGPLWRRGLALAGAGVAIALPLVTGAAITSAVWLAALVVGYQTASITSWLSLHLWGGRPPSGKPFVVATAVTYGRLLIPEATLSGLVTLVFYAFLRALILQGDLSNHDLHHAGSGPWTEAPHVRTRLLLGGAPLRQTTDVHGMFGVAFAFAAARSRASAEKKHRTGGGMLGM